MRTLYFDCVNGAAGDMINAALLDVGADENRYRTELAKLQLEGYELVITSVKKQGLAARHFDVRLTHAVHAHDTETFRAPSHGHPHGPAPHRHLKDVLAIIAASGLSARVKGRAAAIFTRLAEAEAGVHGTSVAEVHFHEVGAVDAIVDICGACLALELLQVERVVCSPIPLGSGTVKCAHGIMPVPTPATLRLLAGKPVAASEETGELATPTGAAILTTLAAEFGPLPAGTVRSVGVGAGGREGKTRPNILRAVLLDTSAGPSPGEPGGVERDSAVVLEANLDDITGEEAGHALEQLLAAGALDAWLTPVVMKKSRPGLTLSVLAVPGEADRLENLLFELTPTLGVRRYPVQRGKLKRDTVTVETRYGPIQVKRGLKGGRVAIAKPEYEDCRQAAAAAGVSLRTVRDAVRLKLEQTDKVAPQ